MNPIAYHNALESVLVAQKNAIQHYEAQLAELRQRLSAAEKRVAELEASANSQ